MKYFLKVATDDRLEFHLRNEDFYFGWIFLALGLPCLMAGLVMVLSEFGEEGIEPLDQLLIGAGGMFSSIGILAGRIGLETPKRLRFDHETSRFIISQDKLYRETVELPYDRIKGFTCRKTKTPTSASNVIHEVLMTTTDLQVWNLGQFLTSENAVARMDYLKKVVIGGHDPHLSLPEIPKAVQVNRIGRSAVLHWRSKEIVVRLVGITLLVSMLLIVHFIHVQAVFSDFIYYSMAGILAVILIILLVFSLRSWTRQYRLEIVDGKFRVFNNQGSEMSLVRETDVTHIRAIGVNFEIHNSNSGVLIVDEGMFGLMDAASGSDVSIGRMADFYRRSSKAWVLPAAGWSGVDRIRFAEMLRMLVKVHEGNTLL